MKVILTLAAVATATTDVFLASDRMAASAAVLNSVCDNSQPTALRLHLLAPTKEAAQTLATATETACDGAVVLPYGLAEFETLVRTRVGEAPMWTTALSDIFSPVAPPEPPALWTNGVTRLTKKKRFVISRDICGQVKGKDESDRSSYNDTMTPPNRAFWSGASHAQARVLDALCGGRFRASRDYLSAAGYGGWFWLGITGFALGLGSDDYGWYLVPVVLCSTFGAFALAAHGHWAVFVDVVKPAYPHRSVELGGWPQEFTLIGGIMLLCAAFSSLVAFLGSRADWKFPETTPEVSEPVAVASGGAGREPVAGVVVESWVVEERAGRGVGWWSR